MFEEKSLNESQGFSGEIIVGDCNLFANTNIDPNRKILVATRHLRNDSRTIQLENRYDQENLGPAFVRPRKHFRSNSCDIKIGRSSSRESEINPDYRLRRFMRGHSRNNSRDMDYDQRTAANSGQPQPPQHYNIRYILNQLKTNNASAEQNLVNLKNNFQNRRHMRNHSYGQEFSFLPNNTIVRLNNDCANQFLQSTCGSSEPISRGHSFRHHSRKNSKDFHHHHPQQQHPLSKERMLLSKNASVELNEELEQKYSTDSSKQHSRQNSKDLNNKINLASVATSLKSLIANTGEDGISLRHRRTNSKDLKTPIAGGEHKRVPSIGKMDSDRIMQEATKLLRKEGSIQSDEPESGTSGII